LAFGAAEATAANGIGGTGGFAGVDTRVENTDEDDNTGA